MAGGNSRLMVVMPSAGGTEGVKLPTVWRNQNDGKNGGRKLTALDEHARKVLEKSLRVKGKWMLDGV